MKKVIGKMEDKLTEISKDLYNKASLLGKYELCRLLLTSPVFNMVQREVIEEQAWKVHDKLVALGVKFQVQTDKSSATMSEPLTPEGE